MQVSNKYLNYVIPSLGSSAFPKTSLNIPDQTGNILWIIETAREFHKCFFIYALLTTPKPLTVWMTTNCGKFFNRWEYQTT